MSETAAPALLCAGVTKSFAGGVEALAGQVGMSAASFHRHFKAVTGLSPLQYQKQIRLQEARRRLLAAPGDVTSVALGVGALAQVAFLVAWIACSGRPSTDFGDVLTALSSLAMGLQTGAVVSLGLRGTFTTAATATLLGEAVGAVNRLVAPRLEGYAGLIAAARTGGREHLAVAAAVATAAA